ncbi:MAG: site-specific DNA-methyltransferase [Candidatus Tectomicrobia bacterium]|uniref:site-specific DNA-methyltransferase (adenine-specific) n=1 Tax=Tectimicrobiota bacterium TaxID=2528274 RepID=A0A933LPY4_UNCTE|nr:site-specific DNA-methyltransferase [Candidatus Tectomicrobia bacterium]
MAQINFKGKTFVQNHHLLVKYHELIPVKEKSLTGKVSLHDNLIIHGDNLIALKALLPLYAGKIKCIYIDPPYNTGNEKWVYNDNVNSPMMQDWLGKTVDREDLTRHDKWLCMMMPRLKLLRELLRDDGAIFVSIDYNEEAHLRMLLNEIFGEENYRNTLAVARVKKNIQEREKVRSVNFGYDTVIFYAKSEQCLINPPKRIHKKGARWHAFDAPGIRPTMEYELFGQKPPTGRHWMFEEDKAIRMISNGELRKNPKTGTVQYLLGASDFTLLDTDWTDLQEYDSKWGFQNGEKNIDLVKRIIRMVDEPGALILDSFAGSGTTAHAVLNLNQQGGDRHFILIECEDYADSITAERFRRVINGVPSAKDEGLKRGLDGTFSFFELGKPIELESILDGNSLPSYNELARYVFYTATGEEFDEQVVDEKKCYIGESRNYQVFLFYEPDLNKLKNLALTLDMAKGLPQLKGDKRRLVFAPTKYLDQDHLDQHRIDFAQLPFEIYELTR